MDYKYIDKVVKVMCRTCPQNIIDYSIKPSH